MVRFVITIAIVVCPPGAQLYVVPPDAYKVTLEPVQIVADGLALITGLGIGVTETVILAEVEHELALVPVTV